MSPLAAHMLATRAQLCSGGRLLDGRVRPRDPRGSTSTRAATRPHSRMGRLEGAEVAPPALAPHDLAQLRAGPETETLVGRFCLPRHPSCVDGTEVLGIAPRLHRGVKAIPSRVAIVVEGSISQVSAGAVATTTTVAAATLATIATGGPATVAVAASTPATVVVAFPAAATAATGSVAVGVAVTTPVGPATPDATTVASSVASSVAPSVAPASAISGLGLHVPFQLADLALKLLDHRTT